jgi:hypothetical protein
MINIFKKLTLMGIVTLVIASLILIAPIPYEQSLSLIIDKFNILKSVCRKDQPAIIFLGGSSVLVGIDDNIVKKELNYNPVNMGVFAGFSIPLLMNLTEKCIRKNDIVVLTPEYDGLFYYNQKSIETRKWTLAVDPAFALSNVYNFPSDIPVLFCDILTLCQNKMLGTMKAVLMRHKVIGHIGFEDNNYLNQYGDPISPEVFKPVSRDLLKNMKINFIVKDTTFIKSINELTLRIQKKGATVVFLYPPFPIEKYHESFKTISLMDSLINSDINIPVLGGPNDFTYDYDCFTNTPYHLTSDCRQIRTQKLISLIEEKGILH